MADKLKFKTFPTELSIGDDLELEISLIHEKAAKSITGDYFLELINGDEKEIVKFKKNTQPPPYPFEGKSSLTKGFIEDVVENEIENNTLKIKLKNFKTSGDFQVRGEVILNKSTVKITPKNFVVSEETNTKQVEKTRMIPTVSSAVPPPQPIQKVSLVEPGRNNTDDQFLWIYIRNGILDFGNYKEFMDEVMCKPDELGNQKKKWVNRLPFNQVDAYSILKFATEYYMKKFFRIIDDEKPDFDNTIIKKSISESYGLRDEEIRTNRTLQDLQNTIFESGSTTNIRESYWVGGKDYLPYFETILERIQPFKIAQASKSWCDDSISKDYLEDLNLLELIWSYWHEEGGLAQTMNAISLRFQNVRLNGNDPLAGLNIDPLRPINNLIWGYIEDERNRLSLARRNLEYQYEYGISLVGKAVPNVQVAESRTQFLSGFHNLLKTSIDFYQQANYTTVIPDGFPVLNSLREVHLLLSEGAHNQFGSLPWTARAEMLIQQWLLARPEMREFLGGRIMMPYQEPWMDRVDTMKTLQGWNPTNISHFHDLGKFGEQLLLSIRYGDWNNSGKTRDEAANWAYYWREEIQRYVHAYKAVTGVDLGTDVTDARIALPQNAERYTQPSVLIGRRTSTLPPARPNQLNRLTQRQYMER